MIGARVGVVRNIKSVVGNENVSDYESENLVNGRMKSWMPLQYFTGDTVIAVEQVKKAYHPRKYEEGGYYA